MISDITNEDLIIEYLPLSYRKNFTPSLNSSFLPTVYTTEPSKYYANLTLSYSTSDIFQNDFIIS